MISQSVLEAVFWGGLAGTLYAYVMFPALMRLVGRPPRREPPPTQGELSEMITIVIPAYNEEACVGAKISNTLESDYPAHLREVIVVSDASTDNTDTIASSFASLGVRLLVQPSRQGKTAGLNRAVTEA